MRDSKSILEFEAVLKQVAAFAMTSKARSQLLGLELTFDDQVLKNQLQILDQAIKLTYGYGAVPLDSIHDISNFLIIATKDGTLSVEQIYQIGSQHEAIKKILNYKKNVNFEASPLIKQQIEQLEPMPSLKQEIDRCITQALSVADQASPELSRIRKEIVKKENEVRRKLEAYLAKHADELNDSIITMRNDRLVIPVKAAYKFKFGGIIHDQSDSGQTFYVEPEDVVLINAQLSSLKFQEADEIERILFSLSQLIKEYEPKLSLNFEILTLLDFNFAKAKYAKENNAMVATIIDEQAIELINARHPLLDKKKVVANNFYLGRKEKRIILVTGPNTGGKTVALKTVGLLAMMNQAALPITVDSKAEMAIFDQFFVDIGDDQSIQFELSTFSSHLTKLIQIIEKVTSKSLVLVDELGGGTDPRQGEALAMTILEHFHQIKALVLATTHYYNLKTFAIESGYITNASMLFDETNIIPTYKLKYGIAGKSYAFEISEKLGFKKNLIERAKAYYARFETESDQLIKKLETEIKEFDNKNLELENLRKELEAQKQKQQDLVKQLEITRSELAANAEEKVEELIYDALEKIEEIVKKVTQQPTEELKMHQWVEAKTSLKNLLKQDVKESIQANHVFSLNQTVYVPRLKKNGLVTRVNSDQSYMVSIGNVSINLLANELETVKEVQEKARVTIRSERSLSHVSIELNLIGQRVDEALINLRKYLDSARLAHYQTVRIIHGFGTGALRNAVHDFLDTQKYIKEYRLGTETEGGHGATVVTLIK